MSDKKNQKGARPAKEGRVSGERATSAAFDTWLERKLHDMFDSVTNEPIPEDLLRVIAELDKTEKTEKK